MVRLRPKLHLSRQGRKPSPSRASCPSPDECNLDAAVPHRPAAPAQPAGSAPEPGPAEPPSSSSPGAGLTALPEELLAAVASSGGAGDGAYWAPHRVLDESSSVVEDLLLELMTKMDPLPPTGGMPGRDVLIEMIKVQLDGDSRDHDARRDVFLSLAVTIPPRPRARIRDAFGPLLARARLRGPGRDPTSSSPPPGTTGDDGDDGDDHDDHDADVSVELERTVGVISTLLVLGYSDVCDLDIGRSLMHVNHWSVKSSIWAERRLLKHKDLSLQLAFSMALGLLHPAPWSSSSSSTSSPSPSRTPTPRTAATTVTTPDDDYRRLARRVRADYRGAELTPASQSFWLSWEGLHARSLQLAGLLACVLRACGAEDVPRSDLLPLLRAPPSSSSTTTTPTPSTTTPQAQSQSQSQSQSQRLRVPLLENPGPAVRARPGAWQAWYASRVRDLVASLEDGEWYGYYVYTLDGADNANPVGSSDPAMENVHFRLGGGGLAGQSSSSSTSSPPAAPPAPPVTSSRSSARSTDTTTTTTTNNNNNNNKVLPLEARGGKDGITGEFDLVGTVHAGTGVVSLRKRYKGAHYWDYDGVVTPLGIVGEWGREGTGYDGYFWLWKRSWMARDAVQRNHAYS